MSTYETLNNFSLYFRALSEEGKSRFLDRVHTLSESIEVRGIVLTVSMAMKDILLSYFVQLTFGYKNFTIGNYQTIQLYENGFVHKRTGKEKEALTFQEKIIALSWLPFSKSHLLADDGENLGFYHVAQALVQSMLNGKSADDRFISYFEPCGLIVCQELLSKKAHPFYEAHTHEIKRGDFKNLFPYLMEWFFEKPNALQQDLPNTYAHLCMLMHQDPLAIENDYKFDLNKFQGKKGVSPLPTKIRKMFGAYQNYWIYNLPLIGVLILPVFYLYYIRPNIILKNDELALLFMSIVLAYFALGFKFFVGRKLFKTSFWYAINTLFGAAPIIFCFVLYSGTIFNFNVKETEHEVSNGYLVYGERRSRASSRSTTYVKEAVLDFKDGFLEDYVDNRVFFKEYYPKLWIKKGAIVYYKTATSIWGFEVVLEKEFIDPGPDNGGL